MFCPEVMKPCVALGVSATQNGRRIPLLPVLARFFGNSPRGLPEFQFHWHFHWHWPPLESATRCNSATWSWRRGSESAIFHRDCDSNIPNSIGDSSIFSFTNEYCF